MGLIQWLRPRRVNLGESQVVLDDGQLDGNEWKKSKLCLTDWVASVSAMMNRVKDRRFPTDLTFKSYLREKIAKNIDKTISSEVARFVEGTEQVSPDRDSGSPDYFLRGLVSRMEKYIQRLDKQNEKDHDVFAVKIVSNSDLQAYNATLTKHNARLKSEKGNFEKKTKDAEQKINELETNWTHYNNSKGGGKP